MMRSSIMNMFNSYHWIIKFTVKDEIDNPFIKSLITKEEDNLTTSWYPKAMSSNRTTNYNINHSNNQRISIAISLMKRALSLSDDKLTDEITRFVEFQYETTTLNISFNVLWTRPKIKLSAHKTTPSRDARNLQNTADFHSYRDPHRKSPKSLRE